MPGVKVKGAYYRTIFLPISYCQTYSGYPRVEFVFQHGGALAHQERDPVAFLERKVPDFILPLQHCCQRIHRTRTQSTIAYGVYCKRKLTDPAYLTLTNLKRVWSMSGHERFHQIVDAAIGQWRRRLSACVRAHGAGRTLRVYFNKGAVKRAPLKRARS